MQPEPCRYDDPEVVCGLNFVRDHLLPMGAKVFRTEWEIFAEEEDVAGSIDLACMLPDGTLYLVDWKRSVNLAQKLWGYRKMHSPLDHLDACSGTEYALQLSSYQYVIEKYYGFRVVGRALASLHPEAPFTTYVPYMRHETEYIMRRRREYTAAKRRVAQRPEHRHLVCHISGALALPTFVDDQGRTCTQKLALLRNLGGAVSEKLTAEADALVRVEMHDVSLEGPRREAWRRRMPASGIVLS